MESLARGIRPIDRGAAFVAICSHIQHQVHGLEIHPGGTYDVLAPKSRVRPGVAVWPILVGTLVVLLLIALRPGLEDPGTSGQAAPGTCAPFQFPDPIDGPVPTVDYNAPDSTCRPPVEVPKGPGPTKRRPDSVSPRPEIP